MCELYVHLSGAGGKFHFSHIGWHKMLDLACEYGWEPAGPEPMQVYDARMDELDESMFIDPVVSWDDDDYAEDFLRVTCEDAANIADALEEALDDIPEFNTAEKLAHSRLQDNLQTEPMGRSRIELVLSIMSYEESLSPVDFFSGKSKQVVSAFIEYCRAGGFCIE